MAENYGTLEGTLDEHGVLSGEMSDRATLEGEIQFGSGGGGVLDVFQNGQSVVQGRYAYVTVPTFLRELRSDDYHNTVTTLEIQNWNDKADTSDIPTALSQLDNDANYVQDADYVHTNNNFTDEDKAAIGNIPENVTDLSDVAVDNIQNGQVLKWDATQEKFVNANESGGGGDVTDVKVDGTSVVDPVTGEADIDLTGKADKVLDAVAGDFAVLLANGNCANSGKSANDMASKAEMSVTTSGDQTTIQLKSGTSATVINQHQDISGKADKSSLGTAAEKDSTALIVVGSTDLAEAGAVREAIDSAVASSYHHAGTKTCAELVSSLLVRANEGNVYNMTDSGVTTADFIEGAGKPIEEGANVGIAKIAENTYKFDLLSGFIDTSNFIEKSVTSGFVKNDGSIDTNTYQQTEAGKGLSTNDYDNTAKGIVDGVTSALAGKVDKEAGKGLSTEDYTTNEKNKLSGIASGAEVNVQSDWTQTSTSADDYIKNKPTKVSDFTNDSGFTKVESSTTNGNIKIDSVETPVYRNYGNNAVLTTDKTPFLTRQTLNPTGFSGYVREKLVGASYAWNQLVQNGNFASTDGWSTYQATISVSNNVCTMVRAVASGSNSMYRVVTKQPNHKYLWSLKVKNNVGSNSIMVQWFKSGTSGTTMSLLANTAVSNNYTTYSGIIATDSADADGALIIFLTTTTVNNSIDIKDIQLIDLTLALGSTIADYLYGLSNNGGITKLRDMGCPIDKYTAYGNYLVSSKTSGKKIVGKNLWDGEYSESNKLIIADGSTSAISGYYISSWIRIVGGLTYTASYTGGDGLSGSYIAWYDGGKNVIATLNWGSSRVQTIQMPSNACYMRVSYYKTTRGLQVEIGSSDTAYEPYCGYEISLGNDDLRGKFDLVNGEIVASGDVKESNGEITRNRKRVELNSVNYTYNSTNAYFYTGDITDRKYGNNILCLSSHYTDVGDKSASDMASVANMSMASNNNNVQIKFKNTAYTDATAFKNAMAGVYLEYDLATPTTEQSIPFADPMSMVGATTEEYIDTRDIPCPVGAERQYMGESDDVIPIPSSPMSDGKWVQKSYVSGGKQQIVWEEDTDEQNNAYEYVDLTSSAYEFPCDGYIVVDSQAVSSGSVRVQLTGNNGTFVIGGIYMNITGQYQVQTVFVKKGMKARVVMDVANTRKRFIPLV